VAKPCVNRQAPTRTMPVSPTLTGPTAGMDSDEGPLWVETCPRAVQLGTAKLDRKQTPSLVVLEGSEALIVAFGAGVLPAGNRRRQLVVIHCRSCKPGPARRFVRRCRRTNTPAANSGAFARLLLKANHGMPPASCLTSLKGWIVKCLETTNRPARSLTVPFSL
jgi:hypothetical protein